MLLTKQTIAKLNSDAKRSCNKILIFMRIQEMSFENTVHLYSQPTNAATVISFIGYIIVFMSQVRATGFGLNSRHMLGCKTSSIYMIHQMKRQH